MLSTGMDTLDRRLRGGIPRETLLAVTAPPESQSELLLEAIARANDTAYLTTVREAAVVDERLPEVSASDVEPADLLANPDSYLDVPEGGCLVVDAVTHLEMEPDDYREFLEAAASAARQANGAVVLHAHDPEEDPPGRWQTFARADMTFRISLLINPLAVETRLSVTKHREGTALTEPLKLRMTDHVAVDTSRDI